MSWRWPATRSCWPTDGSSAVSLPEAAAARPYCPVPAADALVDKRIGTARSRRLLLHHRRGLARQAARSGGLVDRLIPRASLRGDQEDRPGRRARAAAEGCRGIALPNVGARCRWRHAALSASHVELARAPRRALPRQRSRLRAAGRCQRDPRAGRRLLATAACSLARRRDDASAAERNRDRHLGITARATPRWSNPMTRCLLKSRRTGGARVVLYGSVPEASSTFPRAA